MDRHHFTGFVQFKIVVRTIFKQNGVLFAPVLTCCGSGLQLFDLFDDGWRRRKTFRQPFSSQSDS